jgi:hypothetical protein
MCKVRIPQFYRITVTTEWEKQEDAQNDACHIEDAQQMSVSSLLTWHITLISYWVREPHFLLKAYQPKTKAILT